MAWFEAVTGCIYKLAMNALVPSGPSDPSGPLLLTIGAKRKLFVCYSHRS